MPLDALIIGAGPAGATIALLLAQAGWSVAIVEKKVFPRRKVCGEFISATNVPLLQKLGIAELYANSSGPEVQRVGLFAANTILTSDMPTINRSLGKWGRALGREQLDFTLLELANRAGTQVWQPAEIENLQRHDKLFICNVIKDKTSEEISARVVIMANGSWERGIEQVNISNHKPSDLLAFKAHFRNCQLAQDLMPLVAFPGGYGGLVHSDNGRVTFSCCIRRDVLQRTRQINRGLQAGEAVLHYVTNNCRGAQEAFISAQREGNWLSAGPIRPGIRKRYHDGIFYVGNIAGEAHPVVAEGISMAMQSAWLLSQALTTYKNDIAMAGRQYSNQWTKHFSGRIYAAALFAQLAMRPRCTNLLLPLIKQIGRAHV